MTDNVSNKFLEKLNQKRAEMAAQEAAKQEPDLTALYADCIPDVELNTPNISPQEQALDEFMRLIPITEAYQKWGGQTVITNPKRTEIKVRCPNPDHPDKDPSACLNTQKNVFFCQKCEARGDIYDLAAYHKGFPVPGYKDKMYFRDLKDSMAADYGLQIERSIAGEETVAQIPTAPEPAQVAYTPEGAAYAEPSLEQEISSRRKHEKIDWRAIVPENTFIRAYLDASTVDTCPEEYHFWSALVAVGMAAGLNRTLWDDPAITGNLFICYTGPTGTGKSRAKSRLTSLLNQNIPFKKDEAVPQGTKTMKNMQSGEIIVKMFQHEIIDPVTNKPTGAFLPVRILIDSEELAGIVKRASRQGNTLKDTLMDLYDCKPTIESHSLANSMSAIFPFGSVVTTTQNKSIRDVISKQDDNSGFVNRWVFATGVAKRERSVNDIKVDMTRAGGLIRILKSECDTHKEISWEPEALQAWDDFFHARVVPDKNKDEESQIFQRLDLLLKKLFLLFTINERKLSLTKDIVERVLALYPYLTESYGIIEEQVSATAQGDHQDYILSIIERLTRKRSSGPTARDIYQSTKHKISDMGTLRKILENFCALGVIQEMTKPTTSTGGRPTKVYVLAGTNV